MTLLTLLLKICDKNQLKQTKKIINSLFKDIEVKVEVLGSNSAGWLQIYVQGEDQQIVVSYLTKKIGICPATISGSHKGSNLIGQISEKADKSLLIDIGVFEPKIVFASIYLEELREQLFLDNEASLDKIVDLFGLAKSIPVQINVIDISKRRNFIKVKLSDKQVSLFEFWKKSLLDRLIVQGVTYTEVQNAINFLRLNRDIINVESIDLFSQVLTCKLGTQAKGLIPKLGRTLKKSKLIVFNPKKLYSNLIKI